VRTCLLALSLLAAACDCGGEPLVDAGPPDAVVDPGLLVGLDSGPRPDGGGPDDAVPREEDPELLAKELCFAYRRALLSLAQHQALASPPPRCSNADLLPEVSDDDLPVGACGAQDATLDLFRRALLGGRVRIDAPRFRACLAKGRAARASHPRLGELEERALALLALPAEADCAAAITPLVTEHGASCVQAWDCAGSLRCEADPPDAPGLRCLAPASEGERCAVVEVGGHLAPRTCASGTACVLGLCTRRLQAGAGCTLFDVPCLEGLACLAGGLCGPPAAAGGSCSVDFQCAAPLACGAGGLCAPPPALLEDGEPCAADVECKRPCSVCRPGAGEALACQDRAAVGEACVVDEHCGAALCCRQGACGPFVQSGGACGPEAPCAAGLLCAPPAAAGNSGQGDDGHAVSDDDGDASEPALVCRPLPGLGEPCQALGPWVCGEGACVNEQCSAGALDDPCGGDSDCSADRLCVEGACARAPRDGAPCTSDGRCAAALYCEGLRCKGPPPAGEACGPGGLCADGAFCAADQRCEATRAAGLPCASDGQCASGLCTENLTCSARGASCLTSREAFAQLLGLALLLPVLVRLRRRRR
jgi:hypothetical protein